MPSLFSSPPKPPPPPKFVPPQNTALTAQLQALSRRQGANAASLTGPGGLRSRGSVLTHSLVGGG